MNTKPTDAEFARYFELSNPSEDRGDLTAAEEQERERLDLIVSPWLYSIDIHELAIESHGLIEVPEIFECGSIYTHWISDRFAVIPEHRRRSVDGHTRFIWAILPFDEQPWNACSLFFEDGKFRRDEPGLLNWPFHVWIYHSIKAREAYKQHFGSEFHTSYGRGDNGIDKWIAHLNI